MGTIENVIVDEAKKLSDYLKKRNLSSSTPDDDNSEDVFSTDPFFKDPLDFFEDESGCKIFMFQTLGRSNIRVWDMLILLPNLMFFLYLLSGFRKSHRRLSASNAPVYKAFFYLTFCSAGLSLLRTLLSILLGMLFSYSHALDELGWVVLHFGLLTTELSVLVLGIAQIDSRKSVRRVILLSSILAVFYSIIQSVLEIKYPDSHFHFKGLNLFGFGGTLFLFVSSLIFLSIYGFLLILPFLTPCHKYVWALPQKKSFYLYALFHYVLNVFQLISTLILVHYQVGLCLLNASLYVYFTLFLPAVYVTFLRGFFKVAQPSLLFSYKAQVDDEQRQNELTEEPGATNPPIIINSRTSES
eukprot:TRINITY_DN3285_c0_g1_i1.p1 TRINITY_DN3285_c0_g1~~TRINITY_DN3285_c0_g1_i1.p1  ORF type:complete len:356 (-),score=117.73 TRINITY_DN3285_c0_g1_i1:95-1162(-)